MHKINLACFDKSSNQVSLKLNVPKLPIQDIQTEKINPKVLSFLPEHIFIAIMQNMTDEDFFELTEVDLDLGKPVYLQIDKVRKQIDNLRVTAQDIKMICNSLRFGSDNSRFSRNFASLCPNARHQ